jgi:ATP-dependent RNA helicase DDX5/DBP2
MSYGGGYGGGYGASRGGGSYGGSNGYSNGYVNSLSRFFFIVSILTVLCHERMSADFKTSHGGSNGYTNGNTNGYSGGASTNGYGSYGGGGYGGGAPGDRMSNLGASLQKQNWGEIASLWITSIETDDHRP